MPALSVRAGRRWPWRDSCKLRWTCGRRTGCRHGQSPDRSVHGSTGSSIRSPFHGSGASCDSCGSGSSYCSFLAFRLISIFFDLSDHTKVGAADPIWKRFCCMAAMHFVHCNIKAMRIHRRGPRMTFADRERRTRVEAGRKGLPPPRKNRFSRQNTFEHHVANDIEARAFGAPGPFGGCGGIGRHAWFRSKCQKLGGSSPSTRTKAVPGRMFRQARRQDRRSRRCEQKVG